METGRVNSFLPRVSWVVGSYRLVGLTKFELTAQDDLCVMLEQLRVQTRQRNLSDRHLFVIGDVVSGAVERYVVGYLGRRVDGWLEVVSHHHLSRGCRIFTDKLLAIGYSNKKLGGWIWVHPEYRQQFAGKRTF